MKWYFAISESSLAFHQHDWPGLIEVAVMSAKKNTDLSPCLLYDGEPNALTTWLESQGVRILPHRVGFFDALERFSQQPDIKTQHPNWLATAAGAFLRIDLPMIEQDDELVLYTDCDVIFQPGFSLKDLSKPHLFAAAGQTESERASASWFRSGNIAALLSRPLQFSTQCDELEALLGRE